MSAPLWAYELSVAFWELAGPPGPFPREMRDCIERALPITIVPAYALSLAGVAAWLRERGIACPLPATDRPLRACLLARPGARFLFLDAEDSPAEQRLSLAHETAHYLRDYWRPRREAERRFGPGVLEVFDGNRPARPEERLHALLRNVPVGCHTHLLARADDGAAVGAEAEAERAADRLAYELLAPAAVVLAEPVHSRLALADKLRHVYGLPREHAAAYANLLLPPVAASDPLLARLRLASQF